MAKGIERFRDQVSNVRLDGYVLHTGDIVLPLGQGVQLCVQGMLLEEHGYKCDAGVIYYVGSRERVRVEFDDELRNATLAAVNGLRLIAAGGPRWRTAPSARVVRW